MPPREKEKEDKLTRLFQDENTGLWSFGFNKTKIGPYATREEAEGRKVVYAKSLLSFNLNFAP